MTLEELSIVYTADVQPAMDSMQRLVSRLMETAEEMSFLRDNFASAGENAGLSLAQGMLSAKNQVLSAARDIATAAADALRSALQIHSPSRVTEEMGMHFTSGLASGILQSAHQVSQTAFSLPAPVMAANPVMENVLPHQDNISITVPLEVDGYQLGIAAIEGINRVSRVSGRAELSI